MHGWTETDNTADTPGKRAPLVLGATRFHEVTATVCRPNESKSPLIIPPHEGSSLATLHGQSLRFKPRGCEIRATGATPGAKPSVGWGRSQMGLELPRVQKFFETVPWGDL